MRHAAYGILLSLATCAGACVAEARVLSHTAVTDAYSVPAVQKRTNRYYLLIERDAASPFFYMDLPIGRPVLYDSTGAEPPRPLAGMPRSAEYLWAAYSEGPGGAQYILLATPIRTVFSDDGGRTFRALDPSLGQYGGMWRFSRPAARGFMDVGGPVARGGLAGVRLGTGDTPFVFLGQGPAGAELVAVSSEGGTRRLPLGTRPGYPLVTIVGSDAGGTRFLVAEEDLGIRLLEAGLDGSVEQILPIVHGTLGEGFISRLGDAYVVRSVGNGEATVTSLSVVTPDGVTEVARSEPDGVLFAIPTSSFDGAWVVERARGQATTLSLHTRGQGLSEHWRDKRAPEVVAVHSDASGRRLLVQARRRRIELLENRVLHDPVLALWTVGQPAPERYDELLVIEHPTRGFVNLDVDRVAEGGPFVFDGGEELLWDGGGAGSQLPPRPDPLDEKGIVRSALRQQLVIPWVVRGEDARGNPTRSDVVLRNPTDATTEVLLEFVPESPALPTARRVTLAALEIRVLTDVVREVFRIESGSGALFLAPSGLGSVDATSSVRVAGSEGVFGMTVPAVDVLATAHPRRPVTFTAAFPGAGFDTSIVSAGRPGAGGGVIGATVDPPAVGGAPWRLRFDLPSGGHARVTDAGRALSVDPSLAQALTLVPEAGEALAAVVVEDTATGDPTFLNADSDLTGSVGEIVPALVHVDGADGVNLRSDLFLGNSSERPVWIFLTATSWEKDGSVVSSELVLLPHETRRIEDVLGSLFGLSGIANLELDSSAGFVPSACGVRVTSRSYVLAANGAGTYGTAIPAAGAHVRARRGEVLEILGAVRGGAARVDLSIAGLLAWEEQTTASVEILDERGLRLDGFDVSLGANRGILIPDLLRMRNLGQGTGGVLVRVIPRGTTLTAFLTIVQPGTHDPAHLAPRVVPLELWAR